MATESLSDTLTADEVALMLRVTPDHVRELARLGALPARRLRGKGRLLFDRREVLALLRPAASVPVEGGAA